MGWRVRILAACALTCALALGASATAGAQQQQPSERRAILVFYAADPQDVLLAPRGGSGPRTDSLLEFFGDEPGLRAGLWSSTQGRYRRQQVLLDISQGTRQPPGLYGDVGDQPGRLRFDEATRTFEDWPAFRARARDVSHTLRPGLFGGSVPGGVRFVRATGAPRQAAIVAADERGRVASLSSGSIDTLAARARARSRSQLVVVSVPAGRAGRLQLSQLARERGSGALLLIVQLPATPQPRAFGLPPNRFLRQPAFAISGSRGGSPYSGSTRRDGLVSSIDFAPTILEWIGATTPDRMRGQAIGSAAPVSVARLDELRTRWTKMRDGRQSASFATIVAFAGILFLLLGAWRRSDAAIRPALRIGALGLLWWPSAVLLAAAVEPATRNGEILLVAGTSIVLGALTERMLPWARAPIAPALVCLLAYSADLALGSPLLTLSALGPSVAGGSRFYGVSNELEPILPIVLLIGLAAVAAGREITRRTTMLYAAAGLALIIVVGWGRMGADVGGVITVGAGVAVAALVMLPGAITPRRLAITALVPVAALALLVAIDLVLSGGSHLTRNLMRADDASELWELVTRRYELAGRILTRGTTPAYFVGALLAVAFAWRNRDRIYPSTTQRAWIAALIGGLTAGIAGALTNDSGPVLFINAVIGLGALTAYLLGRPEHDAPPAA